MIEEKEYQRALEKSEIILDAKPEPLRLMKLNFSGFILTNMNSCILPLISPIRSKNYKIQNGAIGL